MHMESLKSNQELNLMELLAVFYQKKLRLLVTTFLGLVLGFMILYVTTPVYESSIKLTAANEGDVAALNLGRYWDRSPLKPVNTHDVYYTFHNELFSESLKKTFFNQFYLPSLPQALTEKYSARSIYASFSKNFAIAEAPKAAGDRFPKFIVAIRGEDAKQVSIWLKQFVDLLQTRTLAVMFYNIKQQNAVVVHNLQRQIDMARETAKEKRQARIAQLKERLHFVQLTNNDQATNSEVLYNKIKKLSERKSDDAFIPNLQELQAHLDFYKNLTLDADSVTVFHLDGSIESPETPIFPKKKLVLMVSLVLGFMAGIFSILFQLTWRRESKL